jgi:hypothetical protein
MAKLPSISSNVPRDVRHFLDRVREAISGTGEDSLVTVRQLVDAKVADFKGGNIEAVASGQHVSPSAPLNLTTSGALASVVLTWDSAAYLGHAHTEVWAAQELSGGGTPTIGDASLVGMAPGSVFAHDIGSKATRWYWVRFVNIDGQPGPYNAVSGVQGSTSEDPTYVMDILTKAYGTSSEAPFFQLDAATTINGVSIPAGTYMKAAFIVDGSITNAKIGSLTADKITASLLNTVDFYGNTIAGTTVYLGGTVNYTTDSNNNNIGIASVSSPKVTMNSTGASFNVDAFKVSNGSSDITPFKVTNGVVYINSAQIEDGTITFAKIEDSLESTNYVASGGTATPAGWKLDKDGTIDFTDGTITAGTLKSADGNFVIDLTNKTMYIK